MNKEDDKEIHEIGIKEAKGEERKAFASWIKNRTIFEIAKYYNTGYSKEEAIALAQDAINELMESLDEGIRVNLLLERSKTKPGFASLIWDPYYVSSEKEREDNLLDNAEGSGGDKSDDGFPELVSDYIM